VSGVDVTADAFRPDVAVELTPRGLELLETLNDLFDTLAASDDGSEPARGAHGV
jgi:hypothetical protein